jgi:hypothetical protein
LQGRHTKQKEFDLFGENGMLKSRNQLNIETVPTENIHKAYPIGIQKEELKE